jgi:hypothetical protein
MGRGDGEGLAAYLSEQAGSARIEAYPERLDRTVSEACQTGIQLGSAQAFTDLQALMRERMDVLVYIHGFNVSWAEAVGSALALQEMLNHCPDTAPAQSVQVVLVYLAVGRLGSPVRLVQV